jgi:hypothetical protein
MNKNQIKIKKNKFINNKLFVRSKPNIFIGKIIFGNVKFLWENSTHDFSKILNHFIMFFELFFRTMFSIKFIPTCKPDFESYTPMLFQIIDNSKTSNDII